MRQQLFLLFLFLFLFLPHATFCATAGAGGGRCDRRCGGSFVAPYPFGFSGDCPILLGCNATTSTPHLPRSTAAAPYPVVSFNSTSSTFLVSLALSCNRTVREASASLRGARYDVSSRTTLFLRGGCRAPSPSNCSVVLPATFTSVNLSTPQCGSGVANWTCVASAQPAAGSDEAARGQGQFLNWTAVNESRCEDALTATVYWGEQLGEGVPSLELAVAELGWWLDGACANATGGGGARCAQNATCHDVVTPSGAPGHRCACLVDGMSGDGFAAGEGCHFDAGWFLSFLLPWPFGRGHVSLTRKVLPPRSLRSITCAS
ncbi:hypothetical protein PVAP13_3NG300403 [Panicum virgatum]|uniref:Wall-associated receptor kinase galacturonan-binding domain-containing protein n=1 Tax=Panicum virgatum TaxID=38727 RepID=A0A8T0UB51_PANVG|nr:hypothetical protein PVAP13_3NG300403 [Panicum virgatum]